MKRETKKLIQDVIFKDKKITVKELGLIVKETKEYLKDNHERKHDLYLVKLPYDNVGPIYVEKKFIDICKRVNNLSSLLYAFDRTYAGWVYFSTIAYAIGMEWEKR